MMEESESNSNLLVASACEDCSNRSNEASSLPGHLVSLDEQWALWRFVCLRGAGFSNQQALELAVPECATAADQLIQAEQEVAQARDAAIAALKHRLTQGNADQQAVLTKMIRTIKRIQQPAALELPQDSCQEVGLFYAAYQHLGELRAEFPNLFRVATSKVSHAIHAIARDPRFREAVLWQNRQAIRTGINSLLHHTPEQTSQISKQRNNEALVANYIQRYAMKNDSIGFFGPVGCASITSTGETITVNPGPALLAARNHYFEGWCIEALAETLSKNRQLLPWCAPRRMPHIHVEGTLLCVPFAPTIKLQRSHALVLQACDGVHTAQEIARAITSDPASELKTEQEVYTILDSLCESKRIVWLLEISPEGVPPEIALRRLLERIDDEALRCASLASLEQLETARLAVARAAGDPERLEEALEQMDAMFIVLTGKTATRSEGKMYAGRTLLYEDCRRDIEVYLGPEFVRTMQEPLSLLLNGARWFTFQVAELYQQAFIDAFIELTEEADCSTVNFADFWLWMQTQLYNDEERLTDIVGPEFQERWAEIFAITDEQLQHHHLHFTSNELRPRVLDLFQSPGPGWNAARYHSPDVLIAAKSPEAIRNGEYEVILGEFHIAMNTLQIVAFLAQHPCADDIIHAASLDIPEPRVLPILSKEAFPMYRVRPALITPKDFYLIYTPDVCADPQYRALTLGSLVVEESDGKLIVRTHEGCTHFDLIEVFAEFLSRLVVSSFKLYPTSKHIPRISIDRLIVAREAWCFTPSELPFAFEKVAAERFVAARRWGHSHAMPRFVFVKVPTEQKPCFIDFDSPIYIDMLAKMIRRNMEIHPDTLSITITEMLPAPDQTWLTDAEGQHYTSELRFVAVDLTPPSL